MPLVELHCLAIKQHGFDIDLEQALDILDQDELERFHSLKNPSAKACFLQARRIAKSQLAKKIDCSARDVVFSYNSMAKPFIQDHTLWQFNITHSETLVAVAIASVDVGVDSENISRCAKHLPRAETFLNHYAKQRVDDCRDESEAALTFAEHWSCTESYVKLIGSGMFKEKSRVQCEAVSAFPEGKRLRFDRACFTVFHSVYDTVIAVAVNDQFPSIQISNWRTGEVSTYLPPPKI